ncbi:MAG: Ldh family oxidoreductase, partial [Candidatus Rokuibacteriota bacterium]
MPDTPVVTHTRLQEFIIDALVAMKMPTATAELSAALMVRTDLRGVDSHGIGMLPRYHELWQQGYIVMDAEPTVVRDDMATGLLDGQKGMGHYVSTLAMRRCIDKARIYG